MIWIIPDIKRLFKITTLLEDNDIRQEPKQHIVTHFKAAIYIYIKKNVNTHISRHPLQIVQGHLTALTGCFTL